MFTDSATSQLISPKCICQYSNPSQKNSKLEFIATVNVTTIFFSLGTASVKESLTVADNLKKKSYLLILLLSLGESF